MPLSITVSKMLHNAYENSMQFIQVCKLWACYGFLLNTSHWINMPKCDYWKGSSNRIVMKEMPLFFHVHSRKVMCRTHLVSQNHRTLSVGRALYRTSCPTPAMNRDIHSSTRCSQPGPAWSGLSPRMGHHHLSGQPVPAPHHPYCKELPPYIQTTSPLL